ncbi:MAG: hypothetical protein UHM85_02125 [Acutalibacteraceae bacterium]|nr:hypothetical protein [Acutalibacteraceae bacterium]
MKKAISLILSLILIFSVAVPCFASNEEYPTIYVTGAQTNNLFSADGQQIYPIGADAGAIIKEAIGPCIDKLLKGFITNDYADYAQEFYNAMAPVFEKVKLDKNGEASDGSRPEYHSSTVAVSDKKSGYGMWDFRFWYDWRLAPTVTATELRDYIDKVKAATGKDKVQLVGRCYGANVIQAYITLYDDHAVKNVSDIAYYASSALGIEFMSALFSGEVVLEEQAVTQFANFYLENENLIDDPATELLVLSLIELFNKAKVLGIGTDMLLKIFDAVKSDLIPMVVRDTVGSWPSYWAMVTPELYEKSRDFIFAGCEDEYEKFIEKTDKYYYEVAVCTEDKILELKDKGINFYVFSKYGFPAYPLYEGATGQSDADTSLYRQSFRAESAPYGEILPDSYINAMPDKKYLSPDHKVDASTSLLPETSWFFKNLHHNEFAVLHDMTLEIMREDMTVESGKYPQFYNHENGVLSPQEGLDEDAVKTPDGPLASLMRFVAALINFIKGLLRGEINLDLFKK